MVGNRHADRCSGGLSNRIIWRLFSSRKNSPATNSHEFASLAIRLYGHLSLIFSSLTAFLFTFLNNTTTLLPRCLPPRSPGRQGVPLPMSPFPTCTPSTATTKSISANRLCCKQNPGIRLTVSIAHLYSKYGGRARIENGSKSI